ncbi:hypothetical protein ACLEDP_08135 [Lonsdalea quercina]|uniref:hypothetical protein n=1 Tax=Lonsdalea quercina TaxID=71657 RepID=UPI0039766A2E
MNYTIKDIISIFSGVIISFFLTKYYFVIDSDTLNSAIVWHEIELHGWNVMKNWIPTPDNWYFSSYPIHFLFFSIFGASTNILLILAFAQVFFCSWLAALIAKNISGDDKCILLLPVFCCMSSFAYETGYVYHSFSHNITNLYGLFCVYLLTTKKSWFNFKCVLISLLSLAASVSDPWYVVSYGFPIFIGGIYLAFRKDKRSTALVSSQLIYLLVFFSHIIQKYFGLSVAQFQLVSMDDFWNNLKWYSYGTGRLMNLLVLDNRFSQLISCILLLSVTIYGLFKFWKNDFLTLIVAMSVAGVSSSYIIGYPIKAEYAARFLINLCYFVPIILLITWGARWKIVFFLVPFLFVVTSLPSHFSAAKDGQYEYNKSLVKFMEDNNLKFGYGAYWSSKPAAVAWLSNWSVVIRPMIINGSDGRLMFDHYHAQVFTHWYSKNDEYAKRTPQFIAITADPEACLTRALCEDGLKKQFGTPDNILHFQNIEFYVYDRILNNN